MIFKENKADSLPLVSVLMTAYNREQYIGQAIESVLASTYPQWELIIVDDRSSDRTVEIANWYAAKETRILVYQNEKNLGDYPNRNRAASYAKGVFIKYLDADDMLYPHGLEVMVSAMQKYPEAAFGLSFTKIDDAEPYPRMLDPKTILRSEFLGDSYLGVGPSASIIRKAKFDQLGGFNGRQFIGDTELWLRMASCYPMVIFQPALNWWRQHPEQQINQERKVLDVQVDRLQLGLKHLEENRHLFSEAEYWFAIKRRKQHFVRGELAHFRRYRDFKRLRYMLRKSGISLRDFLAGFQYYY
jgi:glycosyltransferase involved in cell wall biosynthesis